MRSAASLLALLAFLLGGCGGSASPTPSHALAGALRGPRCEDIDLDASCVSRCLACGLGEYGPCSVVCARQPADGPLDETSAIGDDVGTWRFGFELDSSSWRSRNPGSSPETTSSARQLSLADAGMSSTVARLTSIIAAMLSRRSR